MVRSPEISTGGRRFNSNGLTSSPFRNVLFQVAPTFELMLPEQPAEARQVSIGSLVSER